MCTIGKKNPDFKIISILISFNSIFHMPFKNADSLIIIYLKGRVTEREGEIDIFHPLVSSCNGHVWFRTPSGCPKWFAVAPYLGDPPPPSLTPEQRGKPQRISQDLNQCFHIRCHHRRWLNPQCYNTNFFHEFLKQTQVSFTTKLGKSASHELWQQQETQHKNASSPSPIQSPTLAS